MNTKYNSYLLVELYEDFLMLDNKKGFDEEQRILNMSCLYSCNKCYDMYYNLTYINKDLLLELNNFISENEHTEYREKESIKLGSKTIEPINMCEVDRLLESINNGSKKDIVYNSLSLSFKQPFYDGNKRTSIFIMQVLCYNKYGVYFELSKDKEKFYKLYNESLIHNDLGDIVTYILSCESTEIGGYNEFKR